MKLEVLKKKGFFRKDSHFLPFMTADMVAMLTAGTLAVKLRENRKSTSVGGDWTNLFSPLLVPLVPIKARKSSILGSIDDIDIL